MYLKQSVLDYPSLFLYYSPLSATTPSASAPLAKEQQFPPELTGGVPQQFIRVRNDKEEGTTCARTDLVYVHPPPEERKALSQPQKV